MMGGYRLAALLLVTGLLAGFAWYLYALSATTWQVDEFERLRFSGPTVGLGRGAHTLWIEGPLLSARRFDPDDYRKEFVPRITRARDGAAVDVHPIEKSQVFNTGPLEGRSLWVFVVDEANAYAVDITTNYRVDIDVPAGTNLAVSRGVGLRTPIWPGSALLVGAGAGGFVLVAALTAARRRRDLRRFLAGAGAAG